MFNLPVYVYWMFLSFQIFRRSARALKLCRSRSPYVLDRALTRLRFGRFYWSLNKLQIFCCCSTHIIGDRNTALTVKLSMTLVMRWRKKSVSVVGVRYFDSYSACYSCNAKVIASGDVAQCTQCGVMQKCKAAKLDVEVFSPVIELLCQGEPSKISLHSSAECDIVINEHCCFCTP